MTEIAYLLLNDAESPNSNSFQKINKTKKNISSLSLFNF